MRSGRELRRRGGRPAAGTGRGAGRWQVAPLALAAVLALEATALAGEGRRARPGPRTRLPAGRALAGHGLEVGRPPAGRPELGGL